MTNSLIPYSFIPGTKAKASEINANFISLAEEIQNTDNELSERITDLSEETSDSLEELRAESFSNGLVGSNTISYTILEAPNGIASYSSGQLTVSLGIKVLMPNGLNDSGTYKSSEFTLEESIVADLSTYSNGTYKVFLKNDSTCFLVPLTNYFVQKSNVSNANSNTFTWYNPYTNLLKQYNTTSSTWNTVTAVPLGNVTVSSYAITDFEPECITSLIKRSDIDYLTGVGMQSSNSVSVSVNSNSEYVAPANGYFAVSATSSSATAFISLSCMNLVSQKVTSARSIGVYLWVPAPKNSTMHMGSGNMTSISIKFVYAGGIK